MSRSFHQVLASGLLIFALGAAGNASAQSTADGKRTLKAEKSFYKVPGMIEVQVRAMRGTLMMTGYVPNDELLKQADKLGGKVKGIKDIRNRIRVREPEVAAGGDAAIEAKLKKAIKEDVDLDKADAKGKLHFTVKDGNIVVKGKVNDWSVAQTLVNNVKKIVGVKTLNLDKLRY